MAYEGVQERATFLSEKMGGENTHYLDLYKCSMISGMQII